MDVVYDTIENDMNINIENIHFEAVYRVGKPRSEDASKSFPRPTTYASSAGKTRTQFLECETG